MLNGLKGLRHSGPVRSSVVLGIPAALLTFVLYLAGKAEHAVLETIGSTVVIHSSSNDAAFIATGGKHEDVHHGAPREEVDGAPEVEGTPAGEEDGEEAYEVQHIVSPAHPEFSYMYICILLVQMARRAVEKG